MKQHVLWVFLVSAIAVALFFGFRPQPKLVHIETVVRAPMRVMVEEEGKTRVVDRYVVSAPVTGTACRVELNVGDAIAKGQPLLSINPLQSAALDPRSRAAGEARESAANSALQAAQQGTQAAEADATLAAKELARVKPLARQGHVAAEALDRALTRVRSTEAKLRSARFAVDVARHELDAARAAVRYIGDASNGAQANDAIEVRSPVDGRLLKLHHECEGVVSAGQSLMEIGDIRSLEVETDLLSADAVRVKPGMHVEYDRWGGEHPLRGKVQRVEPIGVTKVSALGVEEQRVVAISNITSEVAKAGRLGDGYRVESRFILWQQKDVLQVPASSLFRVDDGWALFVMENNTARRRSVEIGQRNGLRAQILAGVHESEQVITHPDDSIADGTSIKPR